MIIFIAPARRGVRYHGNSKLFAALRRVGTEAGILNDGGHAKLRAFKAAFSIHAADIRGLLVHRPRLRNLYERIGLQLRLPDGHERRDIRRFAGVRRSLDAAFALRAAPDAHGGADDTGAPSLLRRLDARKIQKARLDAPLPHIRHVRRNFLDIVA